MFIKVTPTRFLLTATVENVAASYEGWISKVRRCLFLNYKFVIEIQTCFALDANAVHEVYYLSPTSAKPIVRRGTKSNAVF
jgi:hypothetical protein